MSKVGDRVGAILGSKDGVVEFFGFGVYMGDEVPQEAVGGIAASLRSMCIKNPCIELDSGKIVYGCECWWGGEEQVKKRLDAAEVVNVDIDDIRKKWIEAESKDEKG
jgi:hypothetical protein